MIEVILVVAILALVAQAFRSVAFKLSAGMINAANYEEENNLRNLLVTTLIADLRANDSIETILTAGKRKIVVRRPGSVVTLNTVDITQPIPNSTYASVTDYVASQQFATANIETITWISDDNSSPSAGSFVIRRQCNASNVCKDTKYGPSDATPHLKGLQLKVGAVSNSYMALSLESLITDPRKQSITRRFGFSVDLTKGSTYEIIR